MKKSIKLAACLIAAIIPVHMPVLAESTEHVVLFSTADEGSLIKNVYAVQDRLYIDGVARSKKSGENIAVFIMKGNITPADISGLDSNERVSAIKLYDTGKTTENGCFSVNYGFKNDEGEYTVYTSDDAGVETVRIGSGENGLLYTASIGMGGIENIFYDECGVSIPITIASNHTGDFLLNYEVYNSETGELYKTGSQSCEAQKGTTLVDLKIKPNSRECSYGLYRISIDVTSAGGTYSADSEFAIAKTSKINERMGVTQHFATSAGNTANEGKLMKKAGIGISRNEIVWAGYENKPGEYKLRSCDVEWLESCGANNIKPYVILAFSNSKVTSENPPHSESALNAWGEYVYNVVKDTAEYTDCFEVWNEYNLTGSDFNPDGCTPEDYVRMLKITYEKAKLANPDCVINGITSALVSENDGYSMDTVSWIREVLELGGGNYMDAISVHTYNCGTSPESGGVVSFINDVKSLIKANGLGNMPVVISEYGWNTDTDSSDPYQRQAKYTVRAAALTYNKVDKLLWYVLRSRPYPNDAKGFEILNAPQENGCAAKPIYLAISAFNSLVGGQKLVDERVENGAYKFKFTDNKGKDVYMLWCEAGETQISVAADERGAYIYDMYANRTRLVPENGQYVINIGEKPVYLELASDAEIFIEKNSGEKTDTISENENLSAVMIPRQKSNNGFSFTAALYKNGRLEMVKRLSEIVTDEKEYKIINVNTADYDTLKLFLWEYDGMTPMQKSIGADTGERSIQE